MPLRRRRNLEAVLLAVLAPLLVGLVLWLALRELTRRDLVFLSDGAAARGAAVFGDAHRALERLARATDGTCSPATMTEMRRAVFEHSYVREAGLFVGQSVMCNNLGPIEPPLLVTEPGRLVVPPPGEIHIVPPVHTLQGGNSIIVDYRVRDGVGVNVLVNPALIAQVLDPYVIGDDGRVVLVLADGRVLTPLAHADGPALPATLVPGLRRTASGLVSVAKADPYPVLGVVTASDSWMWRRWWQLSRWPMTATFLAVLLTVAVVRRVRPSGDVLREELEEAISQGSMVVHYQPLVELGSGRWVGAEALVRWQHPTRGLVLPGEFIEQAERGGLIEALTIGVIRRARADLVHLVRIAPDFRVGVNLSKQDLESERVVAALDASFAEGDLLPRVVFEITERSLIDEGLEHAQALVARYTARGARFALDDFGTGYSGLSYLRHFALSYVKIDGSFVRAIDTEAVTANIVDGVIALARSLNLELVAEGVETDQQAAALRARGIRLAQGFLFARAMPFEEFEARLRAQAPG